MVLCELIAAAHEMNIKLYSGGIKYQTHRYTRVGVHTKIMHGFLIVSRPLKLFPGSVGEYNSHMSTLMFQRYPAVTDQATVQ